ncbi:MAG: DUF6390 family protein [Patescibacteria group bacterium]|nr:DUF6390 family protein [Patescibacteria group bacterium]
MLLNDQKLAGALLAARYAFMPNRLKYCGPDNNAELFGYLANQTADLGLKEMLQEFQTMFPYLKLIAEANHIADPFNYRVVEAYWIGNELLEKVRIQNFYRYLVDGQQLKKKFKLSSLEKLFGKIPLGAKPHHSFHVLNVPKRTGYYPVEHTLKTINACIITPAKIKRLNLESCSAEGRVKKIKEQRNILKKIMVEARPLVAEGNCLEIGEAREQEVFVESNNQALVKGFKVGDDVALHWNWVCDLLTPSQAENLLKWNNYNLKLLNLNYA